MEAVGVVVLVVLLALLVIWGRRFNQRINAAWAEAARDLEGTYDPKAGAWYRRSRAIDANLAGVPVHVDHYTVSTGKSSTTYTRCEAEARGSGGLELKVYPKTIFTSIGRALGFQDVATGDPAFDEAFVVKANSDALARAWLSPEVRDAIMQAEGYTFALAGGRLKVTRPRLETEAAAIARVAQATAAVARRGRVIHEEWDAFAAKRRGATSPGRLRIEVEDARVPLRIDTRGFDDSAATTRIVGRVVKGRGEAYAIGGEADREAEALAEVEEVPLSERYRVRSADPAKTARRMTEALCQEIERLAPLSVESDGEQVVVVLPGVETDEGRLDAACALAEQLAEADSANYR